MRIELHDDALEFGRVARAAIEAAGGDQLIQRVEEAPHSRDTCLADVLGDLGAWDLDVRASAAEVEAAAALCRAAGSFAAPGSVAERLARPLDLDADALVVVSGTRPAGAVYGSSLRWIGVDLDGRRSAIAGGAHSTTVRKSVFVVDVDLAPIDDRGADDAVLGLVLPCWTLLGMMDRALALTTAYVQDRQQFGKPLSSFQSVQFQLTEAEVERAGVEELAKYALWSFAHRRPDSLVDALALRLAAVEAADIVFRISHQLHGAIGFCDETTISWLSRASHPLRRLPFPPSGTRSALTERMGRRGLDGLYSEPR